MDEGDSCDSRLFEGTEDDFVGNVRQRLQHEAHKVLLAGARTLLGAPGIATGSKDAARSKESQGVGWCFVDVTGAPLSAMDSTPL